MEGVLYRAGEDVDWTILRPGYLVDKPGTGYRLVPERNAMGIVRRPDLAAALLNVATSPETRGSAYGLASLPARGEPVRRRTETRA